jgi:hypothetical protein
MTKKNLLLIAVAIGLAVMYVVYFTDWFRPKTIHIFHTSRANRQVNRPNARNAETVPVIFGLSSQLRLTMIKVVPLSAAQTNRYAQPLWHLVSDSNSVPVKSFAYGQHIRGMKPAVPGARPQPLEPNVIYRLYVEAGSAKGEHDFEAKPTGNN